MPLGVSTSAKEPAKVSVKTTLLCVEAVLLLMVMVNCVPFATNTEATANALLTVKPLADKFAEADTAAMFSAALVLADTATVLVCPKNKPVLTTGTST